MFGLSFEKIIVAGIIAVIVIGPSRLPHYAQRLGEFIRLFRAQVDVARNRATESLGTEDWQTLDPRQYDPRRIVRQAFAEPVTAGPEAEALSVTATGEPGSETETAEAAGSFVITGSSGHPRRRFVARTDEGRTGDDECAVATSGIDR